MPTYRLVVTSEAELDLAEGHSWYEEQAGLGYEFMSAVDSQFEFIESQPLACLAVAHGIRRSVIKRFPYIVYYAISGEIIDILAVWHGSRNQEQLLISRLGIGQ